MKIEKLLRLLNERRVNYVIIGAHACAAHGFVRATKDIDILIDPTTDNIERLKSALEAFGYDTSDADVDDFKTKKVLLRQYWLDTDIHPSAKGVRTKTVLKNRVPGRYENVRTFFASLRDLIRMKRAASRQKDKEDLRYLKEIQRQKKSTFHKI